MQGAVAVDVYVQGAAAAAVQARGLFEDLVFGVIRLWFSQGAGHFYEAGHELNFNEKLFDIWIKTHIFVQ